MVGSGDVMCRTETYLLFMGNLCKLILLVPDLIGQLGTAHEIFPIFAGAIMGWDPQVRHRIAREVPCLTGLAMLFMSGKGGGGGEGVWLWDSTVIVV